MEQLKFKTNIKCSGCVANAAPYLNEAAGDGNWSVNVAEPSKTLTVNATKEKQDKIIEAVGKAGYKAEAHVTKSSMRLLAFMITIVAGLVNLSCDQLNKNNMNHMTSRAEHATQYACPMHPEVTGKKGNKCTKCGMALEKIEAQSKVSMSMTTDPDQVEAGKPVELAFKASDESDNTVVVGLEETHEKMIHVIAVSEDLSWFDHIHAEPSGNGTYTVTETFPKGGNYLVYADYKPVGAGNQTDKMELSVHGAREKTIDYHESKVSATTDGYTLSIDNADRISTGSVTIPILVTKDGSKLKHVDIQDYLGAVAHIILISQDEKDFIHIHPESTDEYPIFAHADIPNKGIYRMWVQFQTNGKVHTADFTLDVTQGSQAAAQKQEDAHAGHKH